MRKLTILLLAALVAVSCLKEDDYHIDITYTGEQLRYISCPLGGIGTGNILINGYGAIRDIEIFNRPSMDELPPDMTFFSLYTKKAEQDPVVRILQREFLDEYPNPFGKPRQQLGGIPRFREAVFHNAYPMVHLDLIDETVPVDVTMSAWSPFIPTDTRSSSLPAAVIEWNLTNPGDEIIEYSVAFTMGNPMKTLSAGELPGSDGCTIMPASSGQWTGFTFSSSGAANGKPDAGNFRILFPGDSTNTTLLSGSDWWDEAHLFWEDFADDGQIGVRVDTTTRQHTGKETAVMFISGTLAPGETAVLPFIFTWHIPYRRLDDNMAFGNDAVCGTITRNYYTTLYEDIDRVTEHFTANMEALKEKTYRFSEAMITSSVPPAVLDAAISNMASLKTNLLMQNEAGHLHGYEGLGNDFGCCAGNCTHVWNYAQTMAALFPSLEGKTYSRYEGSGGNTFAVTGPGSSNAQTLSGWAEYQAMAGYQYDATKGRMKFSPAEDVLPVRFFWSAGTGWGTLEVSRAKIQLTCLHGTLDLDELVLEGRSFFVLREFVPSHDVNVDYENLSLVLAFTGTLSLQEGEAFRMELP